MSLEKYQKKRDFSRTPEPAGDPNAESDGGQWQRQGGLPFVVQKHAASRLHYDFRLELDGVLKSWAVPKGPSLHPQQRSLAVHVEDHPLDYANFEGIIPQGEYGGGTVMLWDRGHWVADGDPLEQYQRGKLSFELHGEKLRGKWRLVRMSGRGGRGSENWLLIKRHDRFATADSDADVLEELAYSVSTGRSMEQIAREADAEWSTDDRRKGATTAAAVTNPAAGLAKAKRSERPVPLPPQLPTLVQQPPTADGWLHELKLDGYRMTVSLRDGQATLWTRGGHDWTDRFPRIAAAAEQLTLPDVVLDGEVVSLRPDGTTDFQALQNAMRQELDDELVYYAFDLPWCDGYDLRRTPLLQRKQLLQELLQSAGNGRRIRYSGHIDSRGQTVLQHACQHALEGIVSKRADSTYQSGRTQSWLKIKCLRRQEFVIGGYSAPGGSRSHFGSLLLGYHEYDGDRPRLVYCGRVGTGFTSESLQEVAEQLHRHETRTCPFDEPPDRAEARDVTWVEPQLVAEVRFSQWTEDGRLRHPSFQGLRHDKPAAQVTRDQPISKPSSDREKTVVSQKAPANRSDSFFGVRLSNPGRVLYPEQGCTKRDLAEYYAAVAQAILPELEDRPLTLVRCPRGRAGHCFYQKHMTESFTEPVQGIPIESESGDVDTYVSVKDEAGLLTLVQMGVLEIHPWSARADRLDRPDRLIFDLDPHESVSWKDIVAAAQELRELLQSLDLVSFVRTTGGKGLHVVVPITRRSTWSDAKQFTRDVADTMVRHDPRRFVATSSKAKRRGKIFIDYLRNARGATAVASYSTRARRGATVATPLEWQELTVDLQPEMFNIETIGRRLQQQRRDPWQGFAGARQSITKAASRIVRKRSA